MLHGRRGKGGLGVTKKGKNVLVGYRRGFEGLGGYSRCIPNMCSQKSFGIQRGEEGLEVTKKGKKVLGGNRSGWEGLGWARRG
jgi:hypothetical protein